MPAGISAREKTHTRTAEILANEHQVEVLLISNHWVICRRKYALQIPQDSTRDREREREREKESLLLDDYFGPNDAQGQLIQAQ